MRDMGEILISEPQSQLRLLREAKTLTQKELAELMNVSHITIQSWERKNTKIVKKWIVIIHFCIFFSCQPQDLIYPCITEELALSDNNLTLENIRETAMVLTDVPQQTKIRHCRKTKNVTQEQLAGLLNLSKNTIQNWESANTHYHYFLKFSKLCKILSCMPEDLVSPLPNMNTYSLMK
jgi:transcriptional regulator with XRE-family HTH domain